LLEKFHFSTPRLYLWLISLNPILSRNYENFNSLSELLGIWLVFNEKFTGNSSLKNNNNNKINSKNYLQ
jgi:hypothetical protein